MLQACVLAGYDRY